MISIYEEKVSTSSKYDEENGKQKIYVRRSVTYR